MENIKDATFYATKIAKEPRHKFIFSYNGNRSLLIKKTNELYPITIGNNPCTFYVKLDGLPKISSTEFNLDKNAISIVCDEYSKFSIASELIYSVVKNNDLEKIKSVEDTLLNYVNRIISKDSSVNSIQELLQLLRETKKIYFETYCNYLQKGTLINPSDKTSFSFIELPEFVNYTKQMLGKEEHISLVLDNNQKVCLESYKSINNLVSSRINKDISVNILTEPDSWGSYYDQGGQLIEATHDYENVEYDDSSKEYLIKMKKIYQKKYS
jgi:hypothetical protein